METANKKMRMAEADRQHWEILALNLGLSVEELTKLSFDDIDELIEKKIGKLEYGKYSIGGLIPRGNILLALGRFIEYDRLIRRFNKVF